MTTRNLETETWPPFFWQQLWTAYSAEPKINYISKNPKHKQTNYNISVEFLCMDIEIIRIKQCSKINGTAISLRTQNSLKKIIHTISRPHPELKPNFRQAKLTTIDD